MDFQKLINLFEMRKRIGCLIIYWTVVFLQFVYNFSELLLCKINIFDVFSIIVFCCIAKY